MARGRTTVAELSRRLQTTARILVGVIRRLGLRPRRERWRYGPFSRGWRLVLDAGEVRAVRAYWRTRKPHPGGHDSHRRGDGYHDLGDDPPVFPQVSGPGGLLLDDVALPELERRRARLRAAGAVVFGAAV